MAGSQTYVVVACIAGYAAHTSIRHNKIVAVATVYVHFDVDLLVDVNTVISSCSFDSQRVRIVIGGQWEFVVFAIYTCVELVVCAYADTDNVGLVVGGNQDPADVQDLLAFGIRLYGPDTWWTHVRGHG
ncbi:hypothetical protein C1Y19_27460 [Pseudomonas sp. MPR-LB3]|nr:hypothetical protein C1Y24_31085 [Pseudomonas sp. MPR-R2A4]PMX84558.1 hypothetical protein C1Y21_27675 [Pseudomonas sp. MPR-R2A3]PMY05858.1 hypothetical protein C1Y22_30465 [Pseudomonas sp. MPR-R2A5]PNA22801.1 hypothetical protein C1Y16_30425 [Pseudomonas sp. MPR-ANB1]PNA67994.1 hypothetical protein C1Y19_27460 [Pseudomonas sp. MPR-LB3]